MLIDVILPQLGESVSEGTISKWLVREGDVVKKDQPIVSIATDKADSDLPAPAGGRVAKLLASEGQSVPVRAVIAQIDESAGANTTLSAAPGPPVSMPPPGDAPPPKANDKTCPKAEKAPEKAPEKAQEKAQEKVPDAAAGRSAMGGPLAPPGV